MDRKEIIEKLERVDVNTFNVYVFSRFFEREIKLEIFSGDSGFDEIVISDYLLRCIDDLVDYGTTELEKIMFDVYQNYKHAIGTTDYGIISDQYLEKYNNNTEKANQEFFDIESKEAAFRALSFSYATVVEYSTNGVVSTRPRYVGLLFERPWDVEHELQIEIENGVYKQIH